MNAFNVLKRKMKRSLFHSDSPEKGFLSYQYQRINQRRLEHLASLGLDIAGSRVLEVGAGIGDHTSFFLDRGCEVLSSDAREKNLSILRSRFPDVRVMRLDLDDPPATFDVLFDIVYCYGVLYHLKNPSNALAFMACYCSKFLLLETCVSFGDEIALNSCEEEARNPTQAVSGQGCRPTRTWVYNELKRGFEFVYLPKTQPNHVEFPLDWSAHPHSGGLSRAVFIASRQRLSHATLTDVIPMQQKRH